MCKVMMLTSGKKIKDLKKLVNTVQTLITATDRHGFGWSAQGKSGVFGERMTDMHHGYRLDTDRHKVLLPLVKHTYNNYGSKSEIVGPMLFHGRTSTNDKTLQNTHPIVKNDWYLIHNGVVRNHGPEYPMTTTNDTEHLVQYLSTTGVSDIEKYLTGYYALGAISPEGKLHVVRDSVASLYVAWNRTLESYIFATTTDLIEDLAELMKYKIGPIERVEDNVYAIFDGNKQTLFETIKPRGYDYQESKHASASLGYNLDGAKTYKPGDYADYKSNRYDYDSDDYSSYPSRTVSMVSTDAKVDKLIESALDNVDSLEDILESEVAELFFDETSAMDLSYSVTNGTGDIISPYEFDRLSDLEQLACVIIRPDGTELSLDALAREKSSAV